MLEQDGSTKKSFVRFQNISVLISQLKSESFKRPPGDINEIRLARNIMVQSVPERIVYRNTGYTVP